MECINKNPAKFCISINIIVTKQYGDMKNKIT